MNTQLTPIIQTCFDNLPQCYQQDSQLIKLTIDVANDIDKLASQIFKSQIDVDLTVLSYMFDELVLNSKINEYTRQFVQQITEQIKAVDEYYLATIIRIHNKLVQTDELAIQKYKRQLFHRFVADFVSDDKQVLIICTVLIKYWMKQAKQDLLEFRCHHTKYRYQQAKRSYRKCIKKLYQIC